MKNSMVIFKIPTAYSKSGQSLCKESNIKTLCNQIFENKISEHETVLH